jgi:hypothetical protein
MLQQYKIFFRQRSIKNDDSCMIVNHTPSDNNSGLLPLRHYFLSLRSSVPDTSSSLLISNATSTISNISFHNIRKLILTPGQFTVNRKFKLCNSTYIPTA